VVHHKHGGAQVQQRALGDHRCTTHAQDDAKYHPVDEVADLLLARHLLWWLLLWLLLLLRQLCVLWWL
jgi:hypothetical protein